VISSSLGTPIDLYHSKRGRSDIRSETEEATSLLAILLESASANSSLILQNALFLQLPFPLGCQALQVGLAGQSHYSWHVLHFNKSYVSHTTQRVAPINKLLHSPLAHLPSVATHSGFGVHMRGHDCRRNKARTGLVCEDSNASKR
jgi:hypothetical protein